MSIALFTKFTKFPNFPNFTIDCALPNLPKIPIRLRL